MNPILLISLLVVVLLGAFFIPKQIKERRENQRREEVEDALKHLLDREQQGRHASPESLAGALGFATTKVLKILARMEMQGLIEHRGVELHLTAEGERWAIHVVRAHRLLERYLADEARLPLEKIHAEAHRREHGMTPAQVDAMDAALGYPAHDPHGDPIPNKDGIIAEVEGIPLTSWKKDQLARIVHLEDEPEIAFAQILAEGLRLGQTVRILESSPERYLLSDGEAEYRLAPAVAANVHVAALPESMLALADAIPLDELAHAEKAEIVALDEACQGFTRRRFLDLGLTPGAVIFPELKNSFRDPRGYRVRGTLIALRREQANQIWVKPITAGAH
ncbi:MAG: metal-dependent transcriptional regulator [Anaerolineae bacterium]|jgi:DtxR family transcriptional regulator, Mn-dependent transcriptional regulator|nr:metal-dependent transcriptional regulator [Anaerolineae bacterium]MBT7071862.1 metal-dependent transcriptional regulator [Anaerolineae bacterium]MBT7325404.1 metal-dependent transcriptional regulator [Anaerolineae bacterium]